MASRKRKATGGGRKAKRQLLVPATTQQLVVPLSKQFVMRTFGPQASESKYFDSFQSALTIPAPTSWVGTELDPATLNTLFAPSEGSDIDNRVGRRVEVYKIAIKGVINTGLSQDDADVNQVPIARLILLIDQQTNGVQAQGEEVMAAPGAASALSTITTFQNTANFGRFRVLKDKIIRPTINVTATDGANTHSAQPNAQYFKMTVKFAKPVACRFNATNGGTVGDIVDNSFHLIGCRNSTDFTQTITYTCRTYYKDM